MSESEWEKEGDWPAFPIKDLSDGIYLGMSMRDWLAGQTLPSLVSRFDITDFIRAESHFAATVAAVAYKIADAMIEQRKK